MLKPKYSEVRKYAESIGAVFKLVSAKNSKGIKILFQDLALKAIEKLEKMDEKPKRLNAPSRRSRGSKCCS